MMQTILHLIRANENEYTAYQYQRKGCPWPLATDAWPLGLATFPAAVSAWLLVLYIGECPRSTCHCVCVCDPRDLWSLICHTNIYIWLRFRRLRRFYSIRQTACMCALLNCFCCWFHYIYMLPACRECNLLRVFLAAIRGWWCIYGWMTTTYSGYIHIRIAHPAPKGIAHAARAR